MKLRWAGCVSAVMGVALVVSQAHLGWLVRELRPNIIELQLTFSASAYWGALAAWGAPGQAAYASHFFYDFIHLPIYAGFGHVMARHSGLLGPEASARSFPALLLPVAAVFDLIENLFQLRLLAGPHSGGEIEVAVSALCSACKWGLVLLFTLWMGVAIASRLLRLLPKTPRR